MAFIIIPSSGGGGLAPPLSQLGAQIRNGTDGGIVEMQAGNAFGAGNVLLNGGTAPGVDGGNIILSSGDADIGNVPGSIALRCGQSGNTSTTTLLVEGATTTANGDKPGGVFIVGGPSLAVNNPQGGNIELQGGSINGVGGNAGEIFITGGLSAGGGGRGGAVTVKGGQGGSFGGAAVLNGGDGDAAFDGQGGAAQVIGGLGQGNGNGGTVTLVSGSCSAGNTPGDIILILGDDGVVKGKINILTAIPAPAGNVVTFGNSAPASGALTITGWLPVKLNAVNGFIPFFA